MSVQLCPSQQRGYDKVRGLPLRPVTEYFVEAVQTVRDNKQCYAAGEARSRSRAPNLMCP
jgi:hypothetical protein